MRRQRGQAVSEYLGGLLLVSVLIATVATTSVGATVRRGIECRIVATACAQQAADAAPELAALVSRGAAPADVARFFAALDPGAARSLAREHPDLVGNLDGAPLALRIEANAIRVRRSGIARLQGQRRQFLLFDPSGDGRVAEVFGDLAGAHHLAIVVPGMNNELSNYSGANASRLQREGGGDLVTIQWLGYDTPEGVTAATQGPANEGAGALTPFLEGVRVQRSGLHVTVIGHSYGSLVLGKALRNTGLTVDDAVAVGSPGMGVDHASDLGSGFGRLWAARARWDVVGSAPVHGRDPHSPSFGAIRFHTGDASGHSSYFQEGTLSLRNLALIATGRYTEVVRDGPLRYP